MATKTRHDWTKLDPLIDNLKAQGRSDTQIAKDLGIGRQTLVDHLRSREPVHLSTPERTDSTEVHQGTAEHPGTLERYQEGIEDVQQSVPETSHLGTSEHLGTPEHTERLPEEQYTQEHPGTLPDTEQAEVHPGTLEAHREVMEEVHQSVPDAPPIGTEPVYQEIPEPLSTPEVHQDLRASDSGVPVEHSGVPARQAYGISALMGHPGTPTEEDWELWTTIKARWQEIETMLADRQALLSTPRGTPGHTQEKTYVFDVRHIALIEQYAQKHRLDLKAVIYAICEAFFSGIKR
jgi:hypothetical protein